MTDRDANGSGGTQAAALVGRFEAIGQALRAAPRRTFAIGGCEFECRSDDEGAFVLIENFLPHGGCARDKTPVRYSIGYHCCPEFCAAAGTMLGRLPPDLDLENFEGDPRIACWKVGPLRIWLLEAKRSQPPFAVVQTAGTVTIVAGEQGARTQVMRALREIYLRESEKAGAILMHGGAFVRDGKSTVVVAGKSQGKTTTVLLNLLADGTDYLANDRVVVRVDEGSIFALPFPMAVRVGWGTMKALPPLQEQIEKLDGLYRPQDPRMQPALQRDSGEATRFGADIKVEFTPLEVARIFKVRHSAGAPVERVIVPAISDKSGIVVTALDRNEAVEVLRGQCMTPRDEKWIVPWLVPRSVDPQAVETALANLVDRTRVLRVGFGFDDTKNEPNELVEALKACLDKGNECRSSNPNS